MTLAEWLIKEYENNKAWKAGTDKQTKNVNVQKALNAIGREAFFQQAKELEREGLINVAWRNMGSEIKSLRFPIENLNRLCQREHIQNTREKSVEQQSYIQKLLSRTTAEWLRRYYEEQLEQLKKGNVAKNAHDKEFLYCLHKISELKEHVWERMFSEDVFHDSKKFQKYYKNRVVSVLRKELKEYGESLEDYEVLAEFGIMNYSQSLCWKGRLVYEIDGIYRVDTEYQRYGTVLNAQTLVNSTPVLLTGVKKIMTIENKANYEDRNYSEDTLYIFVHGFLSPKERNFLKQLREIAGETVEYYHWGDMDLGGMRIFHFLKKELFPQVKPYKMDVESYLDAIHEGKGMAFDKKKRNLYEAYDAKELEPLKQCILQHGKDMEQEGISYDTEG